jgi:hypothetical protein
MGFPFLDPVVAGICVAVAVIGFASLSFPYRRLPTAFVVLYVWRIGMDVTVQLLGTHAPEVFNIAFYQATPSARFFAEHFVTIKIGIAIFLCMFVYAALSRFRPAHHTRFGWFGSFLLNLSLAGFAASSIVRVFSLELSDFWIHPLWRFVSVPWAQVAWFAAPLVIAVLLAWLPRPALKKHIKVT